MTNYFNNEYTDYTSEYLPYTRRVTDVSGDPQYKKSGNIVVYSRSPFRMDFENVIIFQNQEEMDKYFLENPKKNKGSLEIIYESDDYRQFERSGNIVIEGRVDKYQQASYMRFYNQGIIFYAFIIDVAYMNENATMIVYEVDVFNTYQLYLMGSVGGYVSQSHQPLFIREVETEKYNIVQYENGLSSGTTYQAVLKPFNINVNWLVFVMKPSTKINGVSYFGSVVGIYKSFIYFAVPVNEQISKTLPYRLKGETWESMDINSLMEKMSESFSIESGDNTVNQCLNVYTSKFIGVDYDVTDDGIVEIKTNDEMHITAIKVNDIKSNNNNIDNGEVIQANIPHTVESANIKTNIKIDGLSDSMLNKLLELCSKYSILPSVALTQIKLESGFGNSLLGRNHNNWSGIKYYGNGGSYTKKSGVTVTQGSAALDGGYFNHYNSPEDWLTDYFYLIGDDKSGKKQMYNVSYKGDWESAVKGLFRIGGASYDYAAEGYAYYSNAMRNLINTIGKNKLDNLDNLIYKNGNWVNSQSSSNIIDNKNSNPITEGKLDTTIQEALSSLQKLKGQPIGNGQCYGLVAYYSALIGGCHLGAGVSIATPMTHLIKGGLSASDIWQDYDWKSVGFDIITVHSINDLQVGDITCYNQKSPYFPSIYGHTGVIYSIDVKNGTFENYEQNVSNRQYCTTVHRTTLDLPNHVIRKHTLNNSGNRANFTGESGSDSFTIFTSNKAILHIKNTTMFSNKELDLLDIHNTSYKLLKSLIPSKQVLETQLLSSEFTKVYFIDMFGNHYNFKTELIPQEKNKGVLYGSVGDSNTLFLTLKNYNLGEANQFSSDIYGASSNKYFDKNYGIFDNFSKNLTIMSNGVKTYMQANYYKNDSQLKSFNENKDLMEKQQQLAANEVDLANRESAYNSDYALETADLSVDDFGTDKYIQWGGTIASSAMNFLFGLKGAPSAFTELGSGYRDLVKKRRDLNRAQEQAETNRDFNDERNSLRSQSNVLNAMQSKIALNQQIRSYNASIKDLNNTPNSIVSKGDDLSYYLGNKINDYILKIELPTSQNVRRINDYFKLFGVSTNKYYAKILELTKIRKYFNYIKMSNINCSNSAINEQHYQSFKSIFISGVRIWNAKEIEDLEEPFIIDINNIDYNTKETDKKYRLN